jgi:hypothetical protein
VVLAAPTEERGAAQMLASYDIDDLKHHDIRILALGKDNLFTDGQLFPTLLSETLREHVNERPAGATAGKATMLLERFQGLPLSAISEFQFQSRKIQHIEFRNVSLNPGQKSDFEIVVEGKPAKRQ